MDLIVVFIQTSSREYHKRGGMGVISINLKGRCRSLPKKRKKEKEAKRLQIPNFQLSSLFSWHPNSNLCGNNRHIILRCRTPYVSLSILFVFLSSTCWATDWRKWNLIGILLIHRQNLWYFFSLSCLTNLFASPLIFLLSLYSLLICFFCLSLFFSVLFFRDSHDSQELFLLETWRKFWQKGLFATISKLLY